jgi:hypothetical protein
VNPNHYAHYAAIVLPVALYLGAYAWHTAASPTAPLGFRVAQMLERRTLPFAGAVISGTACIAAVLMAQSRGAMVAIVGGFAIAGALATSGWRSALHGVLVAIAAVCVLIAAIFILGRTETMNRIEQSNATQLTSRRGSITAAFRIWERFPLAGSGAGTFQDLVLTTGATPSDVIANHAHNDYAETLATTGALGFVVTVVPLLGGYFSLARATFRRREPASWRRRAFAAAALTSIAIAMIHALIDFNFYIPANAATVAAIAGAAVIVRES